MNEHIDLLLESVKNATNNNPWAHLAAQTVSMGYNASMLWHYNYGIAMANASGPGYLTMEQIKQYKQERIKHTVMLSLTCCSLFMAAFSSLDLVRTDNK